MRRGFILFLACFVLWLLVTQANHALSSWHIYLFVAGLFVVYPALKFPLGQGLAAVIPAGLLFDSTTPVAFGTHTLLFAAALAIVHNLRDRVPRDDTVARIIVVLLANLGMFLLFAFTQLPRLPSAGAVWPRLIFDLVCSQVVLVAITPWFMALQERLLNWTYPEGAYDLRED